MRHELPRANVLLERGKFPFVVEARVADGTVVWRLEVPGPGGIYVPPLRSRHGPVWIRVTYADGRVDETAPEGV